MRKACSGSCINTTVAQSITEDSAQDPGANRVFSPVGGWRCFPHNWAHSHKPVEKILSKLSPEIGQEPAKLTMESQLGVQDTMCVNYSPTPTLAHFLGY